MDVKEKKRKKKEKKRNKNNIVKNNIVKVNVGVCICFIFIYIYFNDKITDIKEEFNILIGSRLRIINLYVSDISNFR